MGVLITLKTIRLHGEIVLSGTRIRVADEQNLIEWGYARRLTSRETQEILDDYARYAEKVFSKHQRVSPPSPSGRTVIHGHQESLPFCGTPAVGTIGGEYDQNH